MTTPSSWCVGAIGCVVEAVHLERYDNMCRRGGWWEGSVVEAVHLERYDNCGLQLRYRWCGAVVEAVHLERYDNPVLQINVVS